MFLDMVREKNPRLIDLAFELHQNGKIEPNTYLLDLDAIEFNAKELADEAKKNHLELYMMTKQFGRNPEVAEAIAQAGIQKAVAVDPWEALILARKGIQLGHVGHLVQIPEHMIKEILEYKPEVITVFSFEKAQQISKQAEVIGMVQDILIKVVGENDMIYPSQGGGILEEHLKDVCLLIKDLPGVNIVGITAFPCFLYNEEKGTIIKTQNADTVLRCKEIMEKECGIEVEHVNTPSANAVSSLPLLKDIGATHGEPGHALTGTTPLHGYKESTEIPAMIYVSEVSHFFEDKAYVYGGGYYRRSRVKNALVGTVDRKFKFKAEEITPEAIDYYGVLELDEEKEIKIGDTVVYAFRTQIFVTRSQVALVRGLSKGKPKIVGIYDSQGNKISKV